MLEADIRIRQKVPDQLGNLIGKLAVRAQVPRQGTAMLLKIPQFGNVDGAYGRKLPKSFQDLAPCRW